MRLRLFFTLFLTCLSICACASPEPGAQGPGADAASTTPSAPANPVPGVASTPQPASPEASTQGMVRIPAGEFVFGATEQQFQGFLAGTYVSFPGIRDKIRKSFIIPPRRIALPEFYIDQFEVTNKQYLAFLRATGYKPADFTNYLKHWEAPDKYPAWAEEFPVVWISQDDARAYCTWRKGSLPTEEEWEKAARSSDGRILPWGNQAPTPETSNMMSGKMEPTGNRSNDRSAYDVYDLAGNVAEITSASLDESGEKIVILRGGYFSSGFKAGLAYKRNPVAAVSVRGDSTGCRCVVRK